MAMLFFRINKISNPQLSGLWGEHTEHSHGFQLPALSQSTSQPSQHRSDRPVLTALMAGLSFFQSRSLRPVLPDGYCWSSYRGPFGSPTDSWLSPEKLPTPCSFEAPLTGAIPRRCWVPPKSPTSGSCPPKPLEVL